MYIPRVRTVCRNVPATPDPPKAHTAHSTSRMNWIELELVATVELDSLLDPLDADYGAAQHDRIGRRTATTSMHQTTPGSVKRHARPTGHSAAASLSPRARRNRSIPIRIVARQPPPAPALRASGDHRLVRAITAARPPQVGLSPISAAPPQPRPCRCVWLPAAALIVRAALPDHRTGASGTQSPRDASSPSGFTLSPLNPRRHAPQHRSAATLTRTGLSLLCSRSAPPRRVRSRFASA